MATVATDQSVVEDRAVSERNPMPECLSHLTVIRLEALREAFNIAQSPVDKEAFEGADPLFRMGHQQARLEIRSAILDLLLEGAHDRCCST